MNKRTKKRKIIVTDASHDNLLDFDEILHWNELNDQKAGLLTIKSIPRLVNINCYSLRKSYLQWISCVAGTRSADSTLEQKMMIDEGISYFWMSELGQKNTITKSTVVADSVKLLCLEKYLDSLQNFELYIELSDDNIYSCIKNYCSKKIIVSHRTGEANTSRQHLKTSGVKKLYYRINSFLSLTSYIIQRLFVREGKNVALENSARVTFIDIFTHLKTNGNNDSNGYSSDYWGSLTQRLRDCNIPTNFLHIYYKHNKLRTYRDANRLCEKYSNVRDDEKHAFLDALPSVDEIIRALNNYKKIGQLACEVERALVNVKPPGSIMEIGTLHLPHACHDLYSPATLINCLRLEIIKRMISRLPPQSIGFYICENQPWELATISAWRAAGHGALYGVVHTTWRYWDLRYHHDESTLGGASCLFPLPTAYVVNGDYSREIGLRSGIPGDRIIIAEALRYEYLEAEENNMVVHETRGEVTRALILDDYKGTMANNLSRIFLTGNSKLLHNVKLMYRPHPIYQLESTYSNANIEIVGAHIPIWSAINGCDAVICPSGSATLLFAYYMGKRVIEVKDGKHLDLSPLFSLVDGPSVDVKNFISALSEAMHAPPVDLIGGYFLLGRSCQQWIELIKASLKTGSDNRDVYQKEVNNVHN